MFYGRQRRFVNLNPNRRGDFLNSNRINMFSNSICDKRGGYSNIDQFGISFFDGNFDFDSSLLWIDKVDKLFYMKYILMEDYVEFVAYKLKGRTMTW